MIILIDGEKGLELLCVSHEFQKSVNKIVPIIKR